MRYVDIIIQPADVVDATDLPEQPLQLTREPSKPKRGKTKTERYRNRKLYILMM